MNQYLVPTVSHQNWFLYPCTTPSVRLVANLGSKFPNHQLVLEIQAAFGSYWHHTIGPHFPRHRVKDFLDTAVRGAPPLGMWARRERNPKVNPKWTTFDLAGNLAGVPGSRRPGKEPGREHSKKNWKRTWQRTLLKDCLCQIYLRYSLIKVWYSYFSLNLNTIHMLYISSRYTGYTCFINIHVHLAY